MRTRRRCGKRASAAPRGALLQRIGTIARDAAQLGVQRQHLAQQRVVRIAAAHPRHETARHAQIELHSGSARLADEARGEQRLDLQQRQQLLGVGDRRGELALPGLRPARGRSRHGSP